MEYIAGRVIRQERMRRGISQEEMAEQLGITRPTYNNIEQGKRDITLTEANKVSSILGLNIDVLRGAVDGVEASSYDNVDVKYEQMIMSAIKYGADSNGRITKTKLAKLVYLADFGWYYDNLFPMSGMVYRKLPQGPVPDAYFRAIDELMAENKINVELKGSSMMISLIEPDSVDRSQLTDDEQKEIKKVCEAWRGKNTQEIVDFTHSQLPWQICRDGEVIPYELITQEDSGRVCAPEL